MALSALRRAFRLERDPRSGNHITKLFKSRRTYECHFCNEEKRVKYLVSSTIVPYDCQPHLAAANSSVCKLCMASSMSAQMDSKNILDIGCPHCGVPWVAFQVRVHLSKRERERYDHLDRLAQVQSFTPDEMPDGMTMDDLLARGTRLCPYCRFPFVKMGGCDAVLCGKCRKAFNIAYAPVLEDGTGRRAVDVGEHSNLDIWREGQWHEE